MQNRTSCIGHLQQCTWKTFMIHQTFVQWAYIFYWNLWNPSSDIWALPLGMSDVSDDFQEHCCNIKLLSGGCHVFLLIRSQHWTGSGNGLVLVLGTVREQAADTWANADPNLHRQMASSGNEFNIHRQNHFFQSVLRLQDSDQKHFDCS